MKRRVLAILCVLSILMGMVVMPAAAETTATAQSDVPTYSVGYSKVDISPLTDMNNDNTIIRVPMSGYNNSRERLATSIDEHIYSTCTAITDADGNTVLYFTLDCISPPNNLVADVRAEVVAALGSQGITADRIYINGSHSHEAPDFGTIKTAKTYYDNKATNSAAATNTANYMADVTKGLGLSESITEEAYLELITQWSNYYWDTVIAGMAGAAEEALDDRRACTMTKGQIDTSDYTATQLDSSSPFYNKPMNAVRHYKYTATVKTTKETKKSLFGSEYWSSLGQSTTTETGTYYTGDNFGVGISSASGSTTSYVYIDSSTRYKKEITITNQTNVNEADDVIYLIQFKPTDGSTPIVFANWRGHPSVNGGSDVTEVSSDYIDHFRSSLEAANLRPAFFLGTSGNINAHNKLDDWYTNVTDTDTFEQKNLRTQAYGEMLGQIAVYGLTNNMSGNLGCGTIRTMQSTYTNTYNNPPKGLYEVAKALRDNTSTEYPATGTGSDGVSYTVDSWHNANNIVNRYSTTKTAFSEEVNAIMLGDSVAFVTSPNELFDYYNEDMSTAAADNKWFELNSEDTYGTPFIMGYTNGHNSYLPNKLAYTYENASGSTGSYESYASYYAAGGGEALIDQYAKMLNLMATGYIKYECPEHGLVEWTPLAAEDGVTSSLGTGHFYMTEDFPVGDVGKNQKILAAGETLCFDLNGHSITTRGRSFNVVAGSVLHLLDSSEEKTGTVIAYSGNNNVGGGVVSVASATATQTKGEFNLYGGTLQYIKSDEGVNEGQNTTIGGVVNCNGIFNMMDGKLIGGELIWATATNDKGNLYVGTNRGCGATVAVGGSGEFNISGGELVSGTAYSDDTNVGYGDCVFLAGNGSKMTISGDAQIADIYSLDNDGDNIVIGSNFTGTAALSFNTTKITLKQGLDVGNVESGAVVSGLTCTDNSRPWTFKISGTDLLLAGYLDSTVAVIGDSEYKTLQAAVDAYETGNVIKLIKAPEDTAVTISKDTYLDLNGCNVSAAITATAAPLYVMDSMTDDYNVNDGYGYGKLTGTLNGKIEGVPVDSEVAKDGYLKVTENGDLSFHRVNLQINNMVLRPRDEKQDPEGVYNPDVYYKIVDGFSADSVVAGLVDSYGIAMLADDGDDSNGEEIPTEDKFNNVNRSVYNAHDPKFEFQAGKGNNTVAGTLLTDILKETNNILINRRNANIAVYGRAYIEIDGQYMFGSHRKQTLKSLVQGANSIWDGYTDENGNEHAPLSTEQKEGLVKLYETYSSIFSTWELTNIENGENGIKDAERQDLKILVVGNSHGLDATRLLYQVFNDQKVGGLYQTNDADNTAYDDVVIGALYYSGCTVQKHADYMEGNTAAYTYHKNGSTDEVAELKADASLDANQWWESNKHGKGLDGFTADGYTTAQYALQDEQWDIVVMQTMNSDSARNAGYNSSDFTYVINYINNNVLYSNGAKVMPKLAWHMVWSNPDASEGNGYFENNYISDTYPTTNWVSNHNTWFPGTDGKYDQSVMYDELVRCLKDYIRGADGNSFLGDKTFDYILPSAVAVEYAQDVLGLKQVDVYRDYTHMNDYGRLMVAYTWWAELMGYDSIGTNIIGTVPASIRHEKFQSQGDLTITDDMKRIITRSVNYALDMNDPTLDNAYEIVEDNTISILGIGNSYTIDSMWMLGKVYAAENSGKSVELELGIAYYSGCNLAQHVDFIGNESAVYTYYEWDSSTGTWKTTANMTLQDIIAKKNWEMVSMQQSSTQSGVASTYNSNIQTIQSTVESVLGYKPTYLWNMTWAYPVNDIEGDAFTTVNTTNGFTTNYGSSQATMYKKIVETVQAKIVPDATFEYLMPVGTAIQNANATLDDPDLYRDYTHLNDFARVIAAYVWYSELETVTLDEIKLTVIPEALTKSYVTAGGSGDMTLTEDQISLITECVKDARTNNFETTDTSVYES